MSSSLTTDLASRTSCLTGSHADVFAGVEFAATAEAIAIISAMCLYAVIGWLRGMKWNVKLLKKMEKPKLSHFFCIRC